MAEIRFTVPDDKLPRIVAAMKGLYHNNDGLTDSQWAKEAVRRMVVRDVQRWEQRLATAVAMKVIPEDNELLS